MLAMPPRCARGAGRIVRGMRLAVVGAGQPSPRYSRSSRALNAVLRAGSIGIDDASFERVYWMPVYAIKCLL